MVSKTYIYIYTHICNREREREHMKRIGGGGVEEEGFEYEGFRV